MRTDAIWRTWRVMRKNPSLAVGALLLGLLLLAAAWPVALLPADPLRQDLHHVLADPSAAHPFGTDAFGRDILARIAAGARLSLMEVVVSIGLALLVAVPAGLLCGFVGGPVDTMVMAMSDVLFAFPGIILAILVVSVLGEGLFNTMLAIALFSAPIYARLSRNLALELRHREYVEAAMAFGAGTAHVLLRHVLRNAIGPLLVQSTLSAGMVVLTAASLSFLGLGAQPPSPEWGAMMSDGRNYLGADLWPSLFPGLAIALVVLGFDRLGEGLRHLLDPRR
jgi:glutathione transport system permease protein